MMSQDGVIDRFGHELAEFGRLVVVVFNVHPVLVLVSHLQQCVRALHTTNSRL